MEENLMFDTVARVTVLLAERNMSFAELSRRSGISSSTIRSAAARRTQLTLPTIEQICAALDIPLWKFFYVPNELDHMNGWIKM